MAEALDDRASGSIMRDDTRRQIFRATCLPLPAEAGHCLLDRHFTSRKAQHRGNLPGDKELESKGVNVRLRNGETLGLKSLEETAGLILADSDEPFKRGGMSYRFS